MVRPRVNPAAEQDSEKSGMRSNAKMARGWRRAYPFGQNRLNENADFNIGDHL